MREILFRAYDKTMKRYKPFDGMHDTMTISREGKVEYYNLQNGSGFDEYILEQFTGLTDKNGKKIFEGDIFGSDYFEDGTKFVVVFEHGAFCGKSERTGIVPLGFANDSDETGCEDDDFYYPDDYSIHIKVVGNIHDNPELLEAR